MWGMTFEKSLRMFSSEDDVKRLNANATDAARYRWLRDRAGNEILRNLMRQSRPGVWDELVDEDRRAEPSEPAPTSLPEATK